VVNLSTEQIRRPIRQSRKEIRYGPLEIGVEAIWETCNKFGSASQTRRTFDGVVIVRARGVAKSDVFSNLQSYVLENQNEGAGLTERGKWV
jgi:hypothetical protein